jgi:hypothetical protein
VARIYLFSHVMFFALIMLAAGCASADDPDRRAKAFVDAYYIEYDFDRAISFADGAALERLKKEKDLADDVRSQIAVAQSRSRTYYNEPSKHEASPELVHYTFELEIRQGSNAMDRTAVIMLAKKSEGWRIIAFREEGEPTGERVNPRSTGSSSAARGSGERVVTGATDDDGVRTSTRGL